MTEAATTEEKSLQIKCALCAIEQMDFYDQLSKSGQGGSFGTIDPTGKLISIGYMDWYHYDDELKLVSSSSLQGLCGDCFKTLSTRPAKHTRCAFCKRYYQTIHDPKKWGWNCASTASAWGVQGGWGSELMDGLRIRWSSSSDSMWALLVAKLGLDLDATVSSAVAAEAKVTICDICIYEFLQQGAFGQGQVFYGDDMSVAEMVADKAALVARLRHECTDTMQMCCKMKRS